MGRYDIREQGKKTGPISTNEFNMRSILEDIALLHFYDSKVWESSLYEIYDNKLKKVIWQEKN